MSIHPSHAGIVSATDLESMCKK